MGGGNVCAAVVPVRTVTRSGARSTGLIAWASGHMQAQERLGQAHQFGGVRPHERVIDALERRSSTITRWRAANGAMIGWNIAPETINPWTSSRGGPEPCSVKDGIASARAGAAGPTRR